MKLTRRRVLRTSLQAVPLLAAPAMVRAAAGCLATAAQGEGPFYPVEAIPDRSNLVLPPDGRGRVGGEPIVVLGQVRDAACRPLPHALVEIWQADHQGRYLHPREGSEAPLDPYFRYWGRTASDGEGWYRFLTIRPAPYKAGWNWSRPPHIHFKVRGPGRPELTTQMYFPGHPLNGKDYVLNGIPASGRAAVIAALLPAPVRGGPPLPHFRFHIGLAQAASGG